MKDLAWMWLLDIRDTLKKARRDVSGYRPWMARFLSQNYQVRRLRLVGDLRQSLARLLWKRGAMEMTERLIIDSSRGDFVIEKADGEPYVVITLAFLKARISRLLDDEARRSGKKQWSRCVIWSRSQNTDLNSGLLAGCFSSNIMPTVALTGIRIS